MISRLFADTVRNHLSCRFWPYLLATIVVYGVYRLLRIMQDLTTAAAASVVIKGSKSLQVENLLVQIRIPKNRIRQVFNSGKVRSLIPRNTVDTSAGAARETDFALSSRQIMAGRFQRLANSLWRTYRESR